MKKSITSNPKLKYFTFSSQKKFNFKKALICKCAHARTDAGVLERRQAERTWSGREQDGVASECHGAFPARGEFGLVLPRTFVFCVTLSTPTIYKPFQLHTQHPPMCSCLNTRALFCSHFFLLFLKDFKTYIYYNALVKADISLSSVRKTPSV